MFGDYRAFTAAVKQAASCGPVSRSEPTSTRHGPFAETREQLGCFYRWIEERPTVWLMKRTRHLKTKRIAA
jgi:hypothetical protein